MAPFPSPFQRKVKHHSFNMTDIIKCLHASIYSWQFFQFLQRLPKGTMIWVSTFAIAPMSDVVDSEFIYFLLFMQSFTLRSLVEVYLEDKSNINLGF